jgi:REP element-mobilizing transposase RayT
MSRGARREVVFRDARHCSLFLDILAELPSRFAVKVHGYALMPNHFHLMLESEQGKLSAALSFLLSRFTVAANKLSAWDGPVFRGRFHSRLVLTDEHWTHLLAYVHLNPVKARLVVRPRQFRWTSHRFYALEEPAPKWLTTTSMLELFESLGGYEAYVQAARTKGAEIPDGFESVVFESKRAPFAVPARPKKKPKRPEALSPKAVLRRVADAAGCSLEEIMEVRLGRAGNPARIAAAHALIIDAKLSHREVAQMLAMTPVDVSRCLTKVRNCRPEQPRLAEILATLERWRG